MISYYLYFSPFTCAPKKKKKKKKKDQIFNFYFMRI